MTRRGDRWWMRWYAVRAVRGGWAGAEMIDDDEYVEFGAFSRWQAMRVIADHSDMHVVRRTAWLEEQP